MSFWWSLPKNELNPPLTLFFHGKGKICNYYGACPKGTQYAICVLCTTKKPKFATKKVKYAIYIILTQKGQKCYWLYIKYPKRTKISHLYGFYSKMSQICYQNSSYRKRAKIGHKHIINIVPTLRGPKYALLSKLYFLASCSLAKTQKISRKLSRWLKSYGHLAKRPRCNQNFYKRWRSEYILFYLYIYMLTTS